MANFRPINSGSLNQSALSAYVQRKILIFDISCTQNNDVRQTFDIVYGSNVTRAFDITYSLIGQLADKLEVNILYAILPTTPVRQEWDLPLSSTVRSEIDFIYNMVADLDDKMINDIEYDIATTNPIEIDDGDPTTASTGAKVFNVVYDVREDSTQTESSGATITYGSISRGVFKASVDMSEGDTHWSCSVEISDPAVFSTMQRDSAFTITIGTETFNFIVDSRRQSRDGNAGQKLTIKGVSPTVTLDNPRSANIVDRIYTEDISARDAVLDIIEGYSLQWDILNWVIPANVLAFTDVSPMEAVQFIVEAVGGVVESSKTGTLICRPQYPYRMNAISSQTPDHTFTFDQVFRIADVEETREVFNCVRILDADPTFSDQIEWVQDEANPLRGVIKIWLAPPRDNVQFRTTRNDVSLVYTGTETEELTEVIEIIDSAGSVQRPIQSLLLIEWLDISLGGLTFEAGSSEVKSTLPQDTYEDLTDSISLVRVTYRTEYRTYDVVSARYDPAQFVLENIEDE